MKRKKITEANYKFLNSIKIVVSIVAFLLFILSSIIANTLASTTDINSQIVYYVFIAIQNVSITVFSVFLVEYVVNRRYKEQFQEDIIKVLTNPSMMQDFISKDKMKEIRDSSLEAIYGEKISGKIKDVILNNYECLNESRIRSNTYINIYLSENQGTPDFYNAVISIRFKVSGVDPDSNFEIYCTADSIQYEQYIESTQDKNGFLRFPFLMAKGLQANPSTFKINSFKVNNKSVTNVSSLNNIYSYPLNWGSSTTHLEETKEISFEFETFLNKNENYLFEDFLCVYDGLHIKLIYQNTGIKECKCYSSYKEQGFFITNITEKQIEVDIDDVILSGSFLIFIWNT